MIKLSGCLEMLFGEEEHFVDRIPAAAHAGLDAFEFWGYSSKDLPAVAAAAQKAKLPLAGMVLESSVGMLDLHRADEWAADAEKAFAAAQSVNCSTLICTTGWGDQSNLDRGWGHASIVGCLRTAAPLAEAAGITLVLEPLNILVDHPGYFLVSSLEGFAIVEEVNSPAVKLLYDIYHQQVSEGNLIANITSHIDQIGHFHAADVPGRMEPGLGEINWANVLNAINESGYDKYVGLEYKPSVPTPESLKYVKSLRDAINR
ncbi:MAG TPA: TIM barrel protein [Armatimonadota bacterium]|jgi:hydroxypyruvate isomerase